MILHVLVFWNRVGLSLIKCIGCPSGQQAVVPTNQHQPLGFATLLLGFLSTLVGQG